MREFSVGHAEMPSDFELLGDVTRRVLDGLTIRPRRATEPKLIATMWLNRPGQPEREMKFEKRAGHFRPAKSRGNAQHKDAFTRLEQRAKLGCGSRRE